MPLKQVCPQISNQNLPSSSEIDNHQLLFGTLHELGPFLHVANVLHRCGTINKTIKILFVKGVLIPIVGSSDRGFLFYDHGVVPTLYEGNVIKK